MWLYILYAMLILRIIFLPIFIYEAIYGNEVQHKKIYYLVYSIVAVLFFTEIYLFIHMYEWLWDNVFEKLGNLIDSFIRKIVSFIVK